MRSRTRCSAPAARSRCCPARPSPREVGAGLPTAMTIASPDAEYAETAGARSVLTELSRLYLHRHHRRRGRRRGQERARDRRRPVRWPGIRRQHAHCADHPRPGRDDAARAWRWARSARPSWDSRAWATWCSPAPTITRAIAASVWRWRRAPRSRRHCATSARWSRATTPRGRCGASRRASTW